MTDSSEIPSLIGRIIDNDILDMFANVAHVADGDPDFFRHVVVPHLENHTETELWVLAGMLCGSRAGYPASIVADYARLVSSIKPGTQRPSGIEFLRKKEAEQAIAIGADEVFPF